MRHTTATYNPHLLSREDLIASFVARRPLLDELIDDLRRGGHQHHLLVGARGSGKTTLLLRLAAAIEDDKKLARSAVPLRFPEEQYNVARPSDFWLNCLDALTDALEARGDHAGKRDLESSVEAIEALPDDERTRSALNALTGWARRARKLLVLLVDNLGLILERLRDSQWGLREALSDDNRLVLIGATSTFLEDAAYESPLYDFFNVHELGQLSEEEARSVVAQLAPGAGAGDVQAVLDNDPGRFKALYVLTGGMPRMLALLAGVLAQDGGPAERDLEQMLDQLTPYYKARFDELPAQSQIVVDAVALHWHPITAAECAERTGLDVNVASAQLNRLVKLGLVVKVSLAGASRLGFQLVERFFNIWYLMRASRRARQRLTWFVEFLRTLYSEDELERRAHALLDRSPGTASSTHVLALAAAVSDIGLRRRLEWRATTMLLDELRSEPIGELLDLDGADAHLSPVLDRARTFMDLRTRLARYPKLSKIGGELLENPLFPLNTKIAMINYLVRKGTPAVARWRTYRHIYINTFGKGLLMAIERGEVPSFMDVASLEEAEAMLSLARRPDATAILIMSCLKHQKPNAPKIVLGVVDRVPEVAQAAFSYARNEVESGNWANARDVAYEILRRYADPGTIEWPMTMSFFRACIRHGLARESTQLVAELGLNDRWLPLYEALRIASGEPDRLDHLAPEVRTPTAEIVERLQQPGPELEPRPETRTPPKKPRSRRRIAR